MDKKVWLDQKGKGKQQKKIYIIHTWDSATIPLLRILYYRNSIDNDILHIYNL